MRRPKRSKKWPKVGLPWSKTDVARLIKFHPKTHDGDLTEPLGRTIWAIKNKARKLGLEKDYAGGYQPRRLSFCVPWSKREVALLKRLYSTTVNVKIAEKIGRTSLAVQSKAVILRLRKNKFWSEKDDRLLRRLCIRLSYEELAKRLGRTKGAVRARMGTLGLNGKVKKWTEDETSFLKESYPETDLRTIAKKLGRTQTAVSVKANRIGLKQNNYWSKREDMALKKLYFKHTAVEVAEKLGRTLFAVKGRAIRIGLHKRADRIERDIKLRNSN